MDAVNRDSVLMTESVGFDVLGQYVDGSLLYDLTEQPFTSHVATNWEGFVGLNIYRFFFPRHKIFDYQISEKHPEWRLFNATGAFNREWCYREHERQMLKDNADAFGSLLPLLTVLLLLASTLGFLLTAWLVEPVRPPDPPPPTPRQNQPRTSARTQR